MSSYVYGATEPPERTYRPPNFSFNLKRHRCIPYEYKINRKCAKTSFCAFVIVENICDDYWILLVPLLVLEATTARMFTFSADGRVDLVGKVVMHKRHLMRGMP